MFEATTAAPPLPDANHVTTCSLSLSDCARRAQAALEHCNDPELRQFIQECILLCATTNSAIAMEARTARELRLMTASVCQYCADLLETTPEPWARMLSVSLSRCASFCRDIVRQPAAVPSQAGHSIQ